MTEQQLRELISKGECSNIEFKESLPDNQDTAKAVVCFANSSGGWLIIGVDDNGKVVGVDNCDELLRRIDDVAYNRCEPPVTVAQETVTVDNKLVVVVNVPQGSQRPYRTSNGHYYVRSFNKCRQASREELLRLFQAGESIYYDENALAQTSLSDLDRYSATRFFGDYFNSTLKDDEELKRYLINIRGMNKDGRLTVAGILFFGENPQRILPNARIAAAYIKGKDLSIPPSDKKSVEGRVPQILDDIMRFLKIYVKEEHIIEGLKPENHPEIEEYALREAVVNTVAHRDYTISAPIRIIIFEDRIEFHTPGKLPNGVTIDSIRIGGAHVLRNPTIYNLLSKMGLVTDIGSGVKRIIASVKKTTGKDVEFELNDGEFVMIIPRKG